MIALIKYWALVLFTKSGLNYIDTGSITTHCNNKITHKNIQTFYRDRFGRVIKYYENIEWYDQNGNTTKKIFINNPIHIGELFLYNKINIYNDYLEYKNHERDKI